MTGAARSVTLSLGLVALAAAHAYDVDRHAWRDRLLILAAPTAQHPDLEAQRRALAARRAAIADRRLRVFVLTTDGGFRDGAALSKTDTAALRRAFGIDADASTLLLVGLDGGVKRRAPLDTELTEVFEQIDVMPMRRAEIRARRAAGEPITEP